MAEPKTPAPRVELEPDELEGIFDLVGVRTFLLNDGAEPLVQFLKSEREQAAVREHCNAVRADGKARSIEVAGGCRFGDASWSRIHFVRRKDGTVLAIGQDITHERENERQWREVESWLVTLGETLPFPFWICDRDGRFVLQNPALTEGVGNVIGRTMPDLLDSEAKIERWNRVFARTMAGESSREELETDVGGIRRIVIRFLSPVRGPDGVHGALCVYIDVTELKQTEARLRQSVLELGRAQDTLVKREQYAALGEMAAVVAHEVRNPLGVIANVAALLRKRAGETTRDICDIIEDEVARLDTLVRSLLEFVRPTEPVLAPGPLHELIDQALEQTLGTDGAAKRIRLIRTLDRSLPPVQMDASLLRVALSNVLRNALQAMPEAGELEVSLEPELVAERRFARVLIRDTGAGIPADIQERIFLPFVTTRPMGSGLGLAIVKKVVDAHHGAVELTSEAGKGTTCVIRVPLPR